MIPLNFDQQDEFPETLPVSQSEPVSQPTNGKANGHSGAAAAAPKKASKFKSASSTTAKDAKQGGTSKSKTGKARQATIEFAKPEKNKWVQVYADPTYHQLNVITFYDESQETTHYVDPEFYTGDEIHERFKRACKLRDIFVGGYADQSFFLWFVNVTTSKWRKGAMVAVQEAMDGYVMVESLKARSTYSVEPCDDLTIPDPKWDKLPSFEKLLEQAFDSTISGNHDETVMRFMAGGFWEDEGDGGQE